MDLDFSWQGPCWKLKIALIWMRLVDHASDYAYEIVDSENPESSQLYLNPITQNSPNFEK